MKSRIILTCVFVLIVFIVKGQIVSNLRFEQSGKMIEVYYDLDGKNEETFEVMLFCSQDGGITWGNPLNFVSGAVGEEIHPGLNKKITWDVLKVNENLVAEVMFKVEVKAKTEIMEETKSAIGCKSFTITHSAGIIAPITKTITYGIVETDITGSKKCWISQNLGADHQATAATDASEASAGWYWQFNRKQGYKYDGTTRTPNTSWISNIKDNSDWLSANDPCTILLGSGWRLPTKIEWETGDVKGNWDNYIEPYVSDLKLHSAGYLSYKDGTKKYSGSRGCFWSSSEISTSYGWYTRFRHGSSYANFSGYKSYGLSIRCLRD